jgi:uncharacterized protein (TIRG00374 family)
MRKIVVALVLLLAIAFVIYSFSEIRNIADTLKHSNWYFLAVAFFFECLWLYNIATTFSILYRLVGLQEDRKRLFLVATAANFVNVVAPSAGIGGIAVFLDDANRRGHSTGRVTVVGALFVLFDYIAFLCVLALGWVVLIRRNHLNAGEITASLIMLALAIVFSVLIYLGYRSATSLGNALAWMARVVNRIVWPFIHRPYLSEARAHEFSAEMAEGLSTIRGKQKELIWPFLFSLNNKALLICVMAFTFLALGTPFTIGTLVGGFSIGYLFLIVSPTPSGVGVVEGVLPVALSSLRVKWAAAVLITLVYRGLTFWFPLAVGVVAFRLLQRKPKDPVSAQK